LGDKFKLPHIASVALWARVKRDLVRVQDFMLPMSGGAESPEFSSIVNVLGEAFRENDQRFTEEAALN